MSLNVIFGAWYSIDCRERDDESPCFLLFGGPVKDGGEIALSSKRRWGRGQKRVACGRGQPPPRPTRELVRALHASRRCEPRKDILAVNGVL